eukprot:gene12632-biopygen15518
MRFGLNCPRGTQCETIWEERPRTRPGRVPDASHTIEFEETDASRTRPQPFLPFRSNACSAFGRTFSLYPGSPCRGDVNLEKLCRSYAWRNARMNMPG